MPLPKNNPKKSEKVSAKGRRASKKIPREKLQTAFEYFDRNQNGCIEADELGAVMKTMGYKVSRQEIQEMIREADMDGNDMIDFSEFVRLMESKNSFEGRDEEEELKEAFKVSKNSLFYTR